MCMPAVRIAATGHADTRMRCRYICKHPRFLTSVAEEAAHNNAERNLFTNSYLQFDFPTLLLEEPRTGACHFSALAV